MNHVPIDLLTVAIAAALNLIISGVWYSKWLFGPIWRKLSGVKTEKQSGLKMIYGALISLVVAYFIAFFETYLGVTTVSDGMFVGFCLWLGFVATTQIGAVLWETSSFQLFFIHSGCKLLAFLVMSGVIGA